MLKLWIHKQILQKFVCYQFHDSTFCSHHFWDKKLSCRAENHAVMFLIGSFYAIFPYIFNFFWPIKHIIWLYLRAGASNVVKKKIVGWKNSLSTYWWKFGVIWTIEQKIRVNLKRSPFFFNTLYIQKLARTQKSTKKNFFGFTNSTSKKKKKKMRGMIL